MLLQLRCIRSIRCSISKVSLYHCYTAFIHPILPYQFPAFDSLLDVCLPKDISTYQDLLAPFCVPYQFVKLELVVVQWYR